MAIIIAIVILRVVYELDAERLEQRAQVEHRRRVVIAGPNDQLPTGEEGPDKFIKLLVALSLHIPQQRIRNEVSDFPAFVITIKNETILTSSCYSRSAFKNVS